MSARTVVATPPTVGERRHGLVEALAGLREVVELQTPEESKATFDALNLAYRMPRGRDLER